MMLKLNLRVGACSSAPSLLLSIMASNVKWRGEVTILNYSSCVVSGEKNDSVSMGS